MLIFFYDVLMVINYPPKLEGRSKLDILALDCDKLVKTINVTK